MMGSTQEQRGGLRSERRRFARFDVRWPVEYSLFGETAFAKTANISRGGMLVAGVPLLPEEDVEFSVHGDGAPPLLVTGRVCLHGDLGVHVQFVDAGDPTLAEFIESTIIPGLVSSLDARRDTRTLQLLSSWCRELGQEERALELCREVARGASTAGPYVELADLLVTRAKRLGLEGGLEHLHEARQAVGSGLKLVASPALVRLFQETGRVEEQLRAREEERGGVQRLNLPPQDAPTIERRVPPELLATSRGEDDAQTAATRATEVIARPLAARPTDVIVTATGVSARPTDLSARPTVVIPRSEVSARPTDVSARTADGTEMADISGRPTEVIARPTEVSARPTDVSARTADGTETAADISARPTEVIARPTEISAGPTEVIARADDGAATADVAMSDTDLAARSTDVITRRTDLISRSTDGEEESHVATRHAPAWDDQAESDTDVIGTIDIDDDEELHSASEPIPSFRPTQPIPVPARPTPMPSATDIESDSGEPFTDRIAAPTPRTTEEAYTPSRPPRRWRGWRWAAALLLVAGGGAVWVWRSHVSKRVQPVVASAQAEGLRVAVSATDSGIGDERLRHLAELEPDLVVRPPEAGTDPAAAKPKPKKRNAKRHRRSLSRKPAEPPEPVASVEPAKKPSDRFARAKAYFAERKMLLAVEELEALTREQPRHADAHRLLGVAYNLVGRERSSIDAFRRFIDLAPTHKHAARMRTIIDSYERRHSE